MCEILLNLVIFLIFFQPIDNITLNNDFIKNNVQAKARTDVLWGTEQHFKTVP